ncbi:M20 family metallo-hydrolase [Agrococcus carbonis]|uniref:N-carbamoyl-L-amino-acid hydrolase n=1 Tax=Agrococcus carbonis TaxID=684552 RepID=A0A1H1MJK5_9MICO|nr:M20 family metallo-hydrolase [Agrococcus carbonis]SDR87034.1 N-carbamoyl-L-amino-acid hydrolase [Agrococcus carbonis]
MTEHDFLTDFRAMSVYGRTAGGGVDRQAGTVADHETRAWFAGWLESNGFDVRYDAIANQFGLVELVPGAPYVLVGSHLDSQPLAGRFDGAYGVLAGAHAAREVARRVREGELEATCNLAVVNWFNEEGSRFAPSMMGSSVLTGKLALDAALAVTDRAGVTVADAIASGGMPTGATPPPVAAYAEIHVEQGRGLERSGTTIGLVDGTWAASKYRMVVRGEQSHTGSTVMADRKDALFGAALLIVAARELTEELPEGMLHSSVSELDLAPNSPVTVARLVELNLDLRSPDEEVLRRANALLEQRIAEIEQRARVVVERRLTHEWGLLSYQPEGVELARRAAEALGLTHAPAMTVAGHDSTNMKDVVPTVMLFVPSVDGVSHNEAELTRDEDCVAGVALLTEVLAGLAAGELGSETAFTPAG